MAKLYKISISDSISNEQGGYWRKAELENIYDNSDKLTVNLIPHAGSMASAVVLHDDGSLGSAFILESQSNRKALREWENGDIVSIYA